MTALTRALRAAALATTLAGGIAVLPAQAAVKVVQVKSPGGITAWLAEDHSIPVIALTFTFRGAGANLDPADKQGLSYLVSGLLDEGAGPYDSLAFQTRLVDRDIKLTYTANRDSFSGDLYTATLNKGEAFDLLRLSLAEPRFDPEPVARITSQVLATLSRRQENPQDIADRTFDRLMFGSHPYGRPKEGTPETVKNVAIEDIKSFVPNRFARDRLIIGVAGDITPEELGATLDRVFGHLPAELPKPPVADLEPATPGTVVAVEKDVPQSVAVFGHSGLKRSDPDWYAAAVLDHILGGGGFSSRLMTEVREKRGLAYSVFTTMTPMDHSTLFWGRVSTENARFAESLKVIKEQWRRMSEDGPTQEEVDDAKTYLVGVWPLRFRSSPNIANMLLAMQYHDLGLDYIKERNDIIRAISVEDVRRVARRLLAPERLTTVVVGRPDGIETVKQ